MVSVSVLFMYFTLTLLLLWSVMTPQSSHGVLMWSIKVLFLMNEADGWRGRLQGFINDQINGRLSHGWRVPLGFVSCRFWFLPAAEVPPPSPKLCQQSCRCGERSHLPLWVCVSVCVLCDASTGYCLGVGLWLVEHSLWHDSFFNFFFFYSRACLQVLFLLFCLDMFP